MNRNERIAWFVANRQYLDGSLVAAHRALGQNVEMRSLRDARKVARMHVSVMQTASSLSEIIQNKTGDLTK